MCIFSRKCCFKFISTHLKTNIKTPKILINKKKLFDENTMLCRMLGIVPPNPPPPLRLLPIYGLLIKAGNPIPHICACITPPAR